MKALTAPMLAVLDRLAAGGALVERGGSWVRPDGTGARAGSATIEGLRARGLVIIFTTVHGRTATASPFGVAYRRRFKARVARAKGKIHAEAYFSRPL